VNPPHLQKLEQFPSRFLRNQRDLIIYLPPCYDEQPGRRFPVLYMNDGQNLFDGSTSFIPGMDWHVGETADNLISAGAVEPLIIVGIYNTGKQRIREYTPTRVPRLGGGSANRYAKFVVEEAKLFIEQKFRALSGPENTGIGGSSLGALVSLHLGLKWPQVFGKIAALSPSVWWNRRVILRTASRASTEIRPRIWLDAGTREGPRTVEDAERLRDLLVRKGWQLERDLHYQRVEGGEHNEAAWGRRVGPFLQFLYPARSSAV
jgi:predicted alpha/beta superfamily hydrolase